jgi:hypothetical protein
MGEYAQRKSDGAEVKIGTCEDMYYLRWDQRHLVRAIRGSVDPANTLGLRFRLPFDDEDHLRPGDFEHYNRGQPLYRTQNGGCDYYTDDAAAEDPGIIQLTHPCGLLVNVPCYHGVKLPDVGTAGAKAFWNGKSPAFELSSVKATADGLKPVVHCKFCHHAWRHEWDALIDYIPRPMRTRLETWLEAQQVAA